MNAAALFSFLLQGPNAAGGAATGEGVEGAPGAAADFTALLAGVSTTAMAAATGDGAANTVQLAPGADGKPGKDGHGAPAHAAAHGLKLGWAQTDAADAAALLNPAPTATPTEAALAALTETLAAPTLPAAEEPIALQPETGEGVVMIAPQPLVQPQPPTPLAPAPQADATPPAAPVQAQPAPVEPTATALAQAPVDAAAAPVAQTLEQRQAARAAFADLLAEAEQGPPPPPSDKEETPRSDRPAAAAAEGAVQTSPAGQRAQAGATAQAALAAAQQAAAATAEPAVEQAQVQVQAQQAQTQAQVQTQVQTQAQAHVAAHVAKTEAKTEADALSVAFDEEEKDDGVLADATPLAGDAQPTPQSTQLAQASIEPFIQDPAVDTTQDPVIDAAEAAPTSELPETAPPPVEVRGAPDTVAHLAAQIVKKLEGRSTRFDLELDPAGLGKVDVRVEIGAHGRLTAAMTCDNPQAAAELRSRASELQRALEQAGFDLSGGISFDVAGDRGRQQGQAWQDQADNGGGFRGQAFRAALETAGDAADVAVNGALRLRRGVAGGLDLRI